jgi:predicted lipoprotein with Yx(FWY)xxD motif
MLIMGAALLIGAACNDRDKGVPIPNNEGELTSVKFDMDVSSFNMEGTSRAINPVYSKEGFTIYAFKEDADGDFICNKVISGSALNYANKTLSGTVSVPIGVYKFLPVYGLNGNVGNPITVGTKLTDGLLLTHKEAALLPEIFLITGGTTQFTAADLTRYEMGLTDQANETVSATLHRAVSRVDVMFISATTDGQGNYTEQIMNRADGKDILASTGMDKLTLAFGNLNKQMDLYGSNITGTINSNYTLALGTNGADRYRVTIGRADTTSIGKNGYLSYDAIAPEHLIWKAAHIGGPYLIPNNPDAAASQVTLALTATNTEGEVRPIAIRSGAIPLLRNHVTLVKIYVISSKTPGTDPDPDLPDNPGPGDPDPDPDDGGENTIFDTNVTFEVEIETIWQGTNEAWGELN